MKRFNLALLAMLAILLLFPSLSVMAQELQSSSQPVVSLDLGDIFSILVGLAGLVFGIVALVITAVRSGKSADAGVTAEFERRQRDREWMERNERAYQLASEERKQMFQFVTGALDLFSRLSPWKGDDALTRLLKDIEKPGPDPTLPPAPAAGAGSVAAPAAGSAG